MSFGSHTYPVRVEGRLDPQLSRGLWLVKWLLLIPHLIVLAFLWVAFFVVSVMAFFAILFTERYPRGLFDFNVGVLRWSWRVGFYAFNANGTDRYPPFTLREADYPATLSIEYPARLSRGLVLVKWWLLAIPHYLIVGAFIGGMMYGTHFGGVIGLLVLFAVIALLFTGRYPQGIFDIVLGMNRWALRVAAYVGLMTDEYPPFRLDMGPSEPAVAIAPAGARPAQAAGSRAGWIVLAVFGSLGVIAALAMAAGGAAVLWVDQTQRDNAGFVISPSERLATGTYAVTAGYQRSGNALQARSFAIDAHAPSWFFARDRLGTIRLHVRAAGAQPIFVGIAPAAAARGYLGATAHATVTDFRNGSGRYDVHQGGAPIGAPAAQSFWAAQAAGTGDLALTWPVRQGAWTIVVMNADASRSVAADARIGAKLGILGALAAGLFAAAASSGVVAAGLTLFAIRRLDRAAAPV